MAELSNSELRQGPQKVGFVLIPRFNMMTLTTIVEPMRIANYLSTGPRYEWAYCSFNDAVITASNGMEIACRTDIPEQADFDIIFIIGSWGCEREIHPRLVNWVRRQVRTGKKVCACELGVYALARAGVMSGRQATTHWSCMAGFAEQFPNVDLREQLYTIDRTIMTCAGGAIGMDLMLYLIAEEHGEHLASEVADQIMHHPIRKADAVQRNTLGSAMANIHPHVEAAIKLIEENIAEPRSIPEIAARIGLSQRQLERYFKRHMGCSIVQFSQLLRLQYARVLLTSTRMSIREVSVASGFNSMSHFSHAFVRSFGRKPSQYRQAWPDREDAPSWPGTVYSLIEASRLEAQRKQADQRTGV